ncbi:MAG: cupin domain-containing protein [Candidatus Cloacimonetes bacterium]|nr:cupin domain-containing protein [Candidatus Cloacimonadota bacterium]MBS3766738.1 cupin domain-containing protein [Candidatus Cloacimonadota bacterium]
MDIKIIRDISEEEIEKRGIKSWSIWEKEVSEFPWSYDEKESFYLLEGKAHITTESGEDVTVSAGDYVEIEAGVDCTWGITRHVRKHYKLG